MNKILVWTTEEGGYMRVRWSSQEEYDEAREHRRVRINLDYDGPPEYERPFFIALCTVTENHDFGLGRPRDP